MDKDTKKYTGAFGNYTGGNFNEPKNITSDMWTPISVAPNTPQRQTNKRYIPEDNTMQHTAGKNHPHNQVKSGKSRSSERHNIQHKNVNPERPISQGRATDKKHAGAKNTDKINKNKAPSKNKNGAVTGEGRKKAPAHNKNVQGKVQKNTNKLPQKPAAHAKQPVSQKEYQQRLQDKKSVERSNELYNTKRGEGASHNEIITENSERKQKIRKIRNIISIIMAVVFVAAFIGVYSYSKGAPVQKIVVEGKSVYTSKQIRSVSKIRKGDNMLGIKKKQVCKDIEKKLPYIADAKVDFTLPDTVTITVTSTEDKILINNKNNYICLDEADKILSLKKKKLAKGLYRVDGFENEKVETGTFYSPSEINSERYDTVKQIVDCLEQSDLIKSAIINVADLSDVQITFDDRIRIYMGTCDDIQAQLALAVETIKHSSTKGQKGYVDMRYNNMAYFSEGSMEPA